MVLIFLGVVGGSLLFPSLSEEHRRFLVSIYRIPNVPTDFLNGCTYVLSSSFRSVVLLMLLFLCGLTAFGWPLILLILVLFGFQVGVTNCSVYTDSGFITLALTEVLPLIFTFIGMVIASREALRMSSIFAGQLLPSSAHCGSIWNDFKRYLSVFLISTLATVVASIVKTIITIYW